MNSDQSGKPFKLCFNNEIHRISKLPADYQSLVQTVTLAFKNGLPANWALQYEDSDGDRIMLTSDEDYKAMLECEAESASKSIKIYLIIMERNPATEVSSSQFDLCDISRAESVHNYVLNSQQNEVKVEEREPEQVSHEKIEVPVEEKQKEAGSVIIEEDKVLEKEEKIEPVILAQNMSNTVAYMDVAVDFVNPSN